MCTLNDLLFPVDLVDTKEVFGMDANSDYQKAVVGTIDGQKKILNVCSDRYELVSNDQIFPAIEAELLARNVEYKVKYSHVKHARFYVNYVLTTLKKKDLGMNIGVSNDKVYPIISVNHSYNGLTKYSINFGYFRMVCSNGLTIPLEGHEKSNFSIVGKHTKKITSSIDMLYSKLLSFLNVQTTIKQRLETLADRKVIKWADRLEAVLEVSNIKPDDNQLNRIKETIKSESKKLYDGSVNDWLIYNGINSHIFKGVNTKGKKSKALPEVKRELDNKVLMHMLVN